MKRQSLLRTSAALGVGAIAALFFVVLVGCSESAPPPPSAAAAATNPAVVRTITLTVNKVDTKGTVTGGLSDALVSIDKSASMTKTTNKWVFTVPSNDTYTIAAAKTGFLSMTQPVVVNSNVSSDTAVTLNLPETGRVVNSSAVDNITHATTSTTSIPAAPADATPAEVAAAPTMNIPSGTVIKVDGVVQTSPVAISITPVPVDSTPVAPQVAPTSATTTTSDAPIGGFVLDPPGLTTDKPMTLSIPLAAYDLDDATALAMEKGEDGILGTTDDGLSLQIIDPTNTAGTSTLAIRGHYVAPVAPATVGTISVTISAFNGSRHRGRTTSRTIMTLNLRASNTITPGSTLINSAVSPNFGSPCSISGVCPIGVLMQTVQLVPVRLRIANQYLTVMQYRYSLEDYMKEYIYKAGPYGPTSGLKYTLKAYQMRYQYHVNFQNVFFVDYYSYAVPQVKVTTTSYVAPPTPAGTGGAGGNK